MLSLAGVLAWERVIESPGYVVAATDVFIEPQFGWIYVAGTTSGPIGGSGTVVGGNDPFVLAYDTTGYRRFAKTIADAGEEQDVQVAYARDVLGDPRLHVAWSDRVASILPNGVISYHWDIVLQSYTSFSILGVPQDPALQYRYGNIVSNELLRDLAAPVGGEPGAIICGRTDGSLGGPSAGGWDGLIVRQKDSGTSFSRVGTAGNDSVESCVVNNFGGRTLRVFAGGVMSASSDWSTGGGFLRSVNSDSGAVSTSFGRDFPGSSGVADFVRAVVAVDGANSEVYAASEYKNLFGLSGIDSVVRGFAIGRDGGLHLLFARTYSTTGLGGLPTKFDDTVLGFGVGGDASGARILHLSGPNVVRNLQVR